MKRRSVYILERESSKHSQERRGREKGRDACPGSERPGSGCGDCAPAAGFARPDYGVSFPTVLGSCCSLKAPLVKVSLLGDADGGGVLGQQTDTGTGTLAGQDSLVFYVLCTPLRHSLEQ